jgi:pyruvate kinase
VRILRFNFPHFDYVTAKEYIALIKEVEQKNENPFLLLLDTEGPSVRLGSFSGKITFLK